MRFEIVHAPEEARVLWQTTSPGRDFWDSWEVRECFLRGKGYPLHFVVGYEGETMKGLLPLWFNAHEGRYTWVGDDFPENNKFFLKDKAQIGLFLEVCPSPTVLYYIDGGERAFFSFPESPDHKYTLALSDYRGLEDFFSSYGRKHRKNLLYDMRKIAATGYEAVFNRPERSLEAACLLMKEHNLARFGAESLFAEPGFAESILNLMRLLETRGALELLTVSRAGRLAAAEFAAIYRGTYIVVLGGADPAVPNLGKFLSYKHLERAFALGLTKIDLLAGCAWKKEWHFVEERLYEWRN